MDFDLYSVKNIKNVFWPGGKENVRRTCTNDLTFLKNFEDF